MNAEEVQFQFWAPEIKAYITCDALTVTKHKAWRRCKADRPKINPKHRPSRPTASTYSVEQKRREYIAWANAKGLTTITDWVGAYTAGFNGTVRRVDPDEYFAVTVETESDDLMIAA